jgi:hypothetical protein
MNMKTGIFGNGRGNTQVIALEADFSTKIANPTMGIPKEPRLAPLLLRIFLGDYFIRFQ